MYLLCLCVHASALPPCGCQRLTGLCSLLLFCGSQHLNSGCQVWPHHLYPLIHPTGPSFVFFLDYNVQFYIPRLSLCSPGLPQTCFSSAGASQGLRWLAWATTSEKHRTASGIFSSMAYVVSLSVCQEIFYWHLLTCAIFAGFGILKSHLFSLYVKLLFFPAVLWWM